MEVVKVCVIGNGNNKKKWLNSIIDSNASEHCSIGCEIFPYLLPTNDMVINLWSICDMKVEFSKNYTREVDYYIVFDEDNIQYTNNVPYVLYEWNEDTKMLPLWLIYGDRMKVLKR